MGQDAVGRAVDAALVPLLASLAPWSVLGAHWLPDRDGTPVIWLQTRTEIQRVALQAQVWLPAQVQITLTRFGVPYDVVRGLRLGFTSDEAEAALFEQ